ncbi:formylglycine-generating enzyme family protein [Thermoleophilia bacterium SCSIO 60948]|nr:formylglycine-generating enzyme family protein [Thermoleophilia bacterium SCSIO 60948]
MVELPGGEFLMGSDRHYPEEAPARRVAVDRFEIDAHAVTVEQYAAFVEDTGYVTVAERPLDPADYPGADPSLLVPGSLVFQRTPGPVPLDDYRRWWAYMPGASWRSPEGEGTSVAGRERHPVTQVAHEDAAAYAEWAGKSLPSEAEWEYACRGGIEGAAYAWGEDEKPGGQLMANTWQGDFPWRNARAKGYAGTSPVATFPPNPFGLYDVTGNTWEWTDDFFSLPEDATESPCCVPRNPRVESAEGSYERGRPGETIPRRVIKGGSHLCSPQYCLRFRPAARQGEQIDSATTHIGFRCLRR